MKKKFKDLANFDPTSKTAISVRDGVLEYYGSELGIKPYEKVFKVYRSPATISNAAMKMAGIPVTNEHVDLSTSPSYDGGSVVESEMIDMVEDGVATIAIKNKVKLSDEFVSVTNEKRELSLGYFADLVEHDVYDFEQKDIIPHHLAIVPAGRCGDMCSFIDRKPNVSEQDMKFKFIDEEGKIDIQAVREVVQKLPEVIATMSLEQLMEVVPMLQEVMKSAEEKMPEEEAEGQQEGDGDNESETEEAIEEAVEEEIEEEEIEDSYEDEDKEDEKSEMKDASTFADSKEFADAVALAAKAQAKRTLAVIDKAREYLPETYVFADKACEQIMRDAIATESKEAFEDSELDVAFKMLKKSSNKYQNFGDSKTTTSGLDSLYGKRL